MERSRRKIHLFFLFFLCAFVTTQCVENESEVSSLVNSQPCLLARLSEEQIAKQHEHIVCEFKKSDKIHTGVNIGSYLIGGAAIIAYAYDVLVPKKAMALPKDLQSYSPEQLTLLVKELIVRVRHLELGPNLFSWEYVKSFIYSIIWSPATLLDVARMLYKLGDHYLNHILYSADLCWFLGEKTRIGMLTKRDVPSTTSYEFEFGQLPKRIEECAVALDGANKALLPTDIAFQRRHMVDCCNMIIEDFTRLLAFTKYVGSLSTDEKKNFENVECARYLINRTNSFCEGIEARLNGANSEKFLPLVTEFNAELQPIIIRFAEYLS